MKIETLDSNSLHIGRIGLFIFALCCFAIGFLVGGAYGTKWCKDEWPDLQKVEKNRILMECRDSSRVWMPRPSCEWIKDKKQ